MSFWKFGKNNHEDDSDYMDPTTPDFDDDDDYDEDDEDQALSVDDAALIWLSNGMDEDYTFGYSEDELRDALD